VSWSAIAQIESGRRKDVRLSSLSALADALGVSVDHLIGTANAATTPPLCEHRLLVYGSDEEYLATAIPFLTEGIDRSHCVLAVTTEAKTRLLRDALADRSDQVEFADFVSWYPTPQESLGRYASYVQEKIDAGALWIRVLGEAAWDVQPQIDAATWTRYESLVNLLFALSPATLLCTYDARSLPAAVIANAHRTHPELMDALNTTPNPAYREPADLLL
jgi:transcriptional regulator with XRE-family HTH domain